MKDNLILNQLEKINDADLWELYGKSITELKKRGLIRTRNIVGERGEFLAIDIYNKTKNLPKLQPAPKSTKNIDAISNKGDRYSIKTITYPSKTTGVFYGLGDKDSSAPEKKFEFLIIVIIDTEFNPLQILEIDWELFLKNKSWHSRMNAWNISITKGLITTSKTIFSNLKQ